MEEYITENYSEFDPILYFQSDESITTREDAEKESKSVGIKIRNLAWRIDVELLLNAFRVNN